MLNCAQPFLTPWTVACLAPLSMGFPSQEYWSGLPFHSPGDLPDPGIEFQQRLKHLYCTKKRLFQKDAEGTYKLEVWD